MAIPRDDAATVAAPARVRSPAWTWIAVASIVGAVGLAAVAIRLVPGGVPARGILGAADGPAILDTPAPDLELDILGAPGTFALSKFRGHVTVVNFWASWCTPCRDEAPALEATWREFRPSGVRFLGIDELDDDAAASAFVREFGLTYPIASDPGGTLSDDFSLFGLPETFVVDAEGTIRYRFTGYVDDRALRRVLDGMVRR